MKTYAQAKKTPKRGWKYADDESMCSVVADMIAMRCCLNAKVVYDWIRKHYGTDYMRVSKMRGSGEPVPYYDLVGCILDDVPAPVCLEQS